MMPLAPIELWLALGIGLFAAAAAPGGLKRWRWGTAAVIALLLGASAVLAWRAEPAPFPRWGNGLVFDSLGQLLLPPLWAGGAMAMIACLFIGEPGYELSLAALSLAAASAGIVSTNPLMTVALLEVSALLVLGGLIVHAERGGAQPLLAIATGLKYLVITMVSAGCLVMALLLSSFYALNQDRIELPRIIAALLVIGFGLAVGAMPFYFHVPDIFDGGAAITAVSFAGPLQCLAFVYLLRTAGNDPWLLGDQHVADVLLLGALGGGLLAAAMAFGQRSASRLLAFNALREVGWLLFGVASVSRQGWTGVLILLAARCVGQPLLIVSGALLQALGGGRSVVNLSGAAKRLPLATFAWCAGVLCSVGLPPLAGFWGGQALLRGGLGIGWLAAGLFAAAGVLSLWRFGQVTASAFGRAVTVATSESGLLAPCLALACAALGLVAGGFWTKLFDVPVSQTLAAFPFLK